ncbi:hypothetical protein [Pedobacter frigoris]|uniref:hypothetical protein n=1 Tax=Pedobacter frigoris TaxID=2571272 RepID=UPI00292F0B3F|nr:hypothetical protein [Pedobacter frigoris]
MRLKLILIWFSGVLCFSLSAKAQENEHLYIQGRRYMDINIHALDKYSKRLERTQKNLLNKLKRKEQRLAHRLKRTDSVAYARFKNDPLTYDSISKLARHPDSATITAKTLKGGQKAVDSLKGVYNFLQRKAGQAGSTVNSGLSTLNNAGVTTGLEGYSQELSNLQNRLAYDQYITDLTSKHALNLQSIAGGKGNITGIQKELFYAKAKMNEWKKIAEDPSALEEKALEYLQGTKGFDISLDKALNSQPGNSMNSATSADDLEKMGFMTKRMMNNALQQKFGNSLQAVQGNVGKEVSQWQDKAQTLHGQVKETKQSLSALKNTGKPSFKVNPMRGLPFWHRVEKQYSFNTARAATTADGTPRPAILTLSAGLAYRQTPKLSAGIGIAGDIGLGQNWSSIRFTFEGIGFRTFLDWKWQYGIGAYAGYERTYRQAAFSGTKETSTPMLQPSPHNNQNWSEALLLGITKSYKINSRWYGTIQVLYDVWWRDKGLRSPVILRFVNAT